MRSLTSLIHWISLPGITLLRSDNIFNERTNVLRWESTYSNTTGQLEYSLNDGNSWRAIDDAIDLTKGIL